MKRCLVVFLFTSAMVVLGGCDGSQRDKQIGAATRSGTEPARTSSAVPETITPQPIPPPAVGTLLTSGTIRLSDGRAGSGTLVTAVRWERRGDRSTSVALARTQADAAGHYCVETTGTVPTTMSFDHRDAIILYEPIVAPDTVTSGPSHIALNVELPIRSHIAGVVVDSTSHPLAGVSLTATTETARRGFPFSVVGQTTTSADGIFCLDRVSTGMFRLGASRADLPYVQREVVAPDDTVVIAMPLSLTLDGRAVMRRTGSPATSITVMLFPEDFRTRRSSHPRSSKSVTGSDGAFRFRGIPPDAYRLVIPSDTSYTLARQVPVDMTDGRSTSGIVLELLEREELAIRGRVVDSVSGAPVPGVTVSQHYGLPKSPVVVSAKDGSYRLPLPRARLGETISLCAARKGFSMRDSNSSGQEFVNVRLDAKLPETQYDIAMERLPEVSGKVLDSADSLVADARVEVQSFDQKRYIEPQQTLGDGSFLFYVRPFSKVRLQASAEGFSTTFTEQMNVGSTGQKGLELRLSSEATISGRVVDSASSPTKDAIVVAKCPLHDDDRRGFGWHDLQVAKATTDEKGIFQLRGLPAGRLYLLASKEQFIDSNIESVALSAGEKKDGVVLTLRETHYLAGHVRDPNRNPLSGMRVSAHSPNVADSRRVAETDNNGRYRLDGLGPGPLTVCVSRPGEVEDVHRDVAPDRNDADFIYDDKKTRSGTIIGKVVDIASKQPLKSFTVNGKSDVLGSEPGSFALTGLHLMSTEVKITAPEYAITEFLVGLSPEHPVVEQIFEIGRGGEVTGRVVDVAGRQPLAGVEVQDLGLRVYGESMPYRALATAHTNERGTFEIAGMAAGKHVLLFKGNPPLRDRTAQAEITEGRTTDLGEIEMGEGGQISGTVLLLPERSPVADEEVCVGLSTVSPPWKRMRSGAAGEFKFDALPEGRVTIWLPRLAISKGLNLKPNEQKKEDLYVGGVMLRGRIIYGKTPLKCTVTVHSMAKYPPGPPLATVQTNEGGMFDIGLAEGSYEFMATVPGQPKPVRAGAMAIGHNSQMNEMSYDFVIPVGQVRGKVLLPDGAPASGADVSLAVAGMPGPVKLTKTATDGTFEIVNVADNSYTVTARVKDVGDGTSPPVTVAADSPAPPVTIQIVPRAYGALEVVVRNESGEPVTGHTPNLDLYQGAARIECRISTYPRSGVWKFADVPEGQYELRIGFRPDAMQSHQVQIVAGQSARMEVRLAAAP